MTRDTTTGTTYEKVVYSLIENFGHNYKKQVMLGKKRNGKRHIVDLIIEGKTLVSLKNQKVAGTAEEKVPFEFMKLQHAIDDYGYTNAIIVLNGDTGWTWKEYYLCKEFKKAMKILYPNVEIMNHEQFISRYNNVKYST